VLDRFEKGIERAVNGAFAKAFRSEVQPVEIASALRRECDEKAAIVARDRTIAPNAFVVELGTADHERLGQWEEALGDELAAVVSDYVRHQRYHLAGPVDVAFERAEDLDTGLFRVRSRTSRGDSSSGRRAAGAPVEGPAGPGSGGGRRAAPPPPPQSGWSQPGGPAGGDAGYPPPPGAALAESRADTRPSLDIAGQAYQITRPVTVIGRGTDTDVMLDDSGVSRRHAEIHITDGRARIIDLGSTNGTYVDGAKRPVSTLVEGSVITIGRTRMVFHPGDLTSVTSPESFGDHGPW
jgi:hypothetical protein